MTINIFERPEMVIQDLQQRQNILDQRFDVLAGLVANLEQRVIKLESGNPPPPPPPPPPTYDALWLSTADIMALPMTGPAWEAAYNAAMSDWGIARLDYNDSKHDTFTYIGAVVSVARGDTVLRNKVIDGLKSAMQSGTNEVLQLARGIQAYIIAASIIQYDDFAFRDWVAQMVVKSMRGHSGGGNLLETAQLSANNWGGHARASLAAAAVYLNRVDWLDIVTEAHLEFIGAPVTTKRLDYDATTWHAALEDTSQFSAVYDQLSGINRKGSKRGNISISGVTPEDWRRGNYHFVWPPVLSNDYYWEAMQGFVVAAVILHRAGRVPITAGENAVERAMDMLFGTGEAAQNVPHVVIPSAGDDTWIAHLVNSYTVSQYPTVEVSRPGKGMGYTCWTHKR